MIENTINNVKEYLMNKGFYKRSFADNALLSMIDKYENFDFITDVIDNVLFVILILNLIAFFIYVIKETGFYKTIGDFLDYLKAVLYGDGIYRWAIHVFNTTTLFSPMIAILLFISYRIIGLNEELILAFIFLSFFYNDIFVML